MSSTTTIRPPADPATAPFTVEHRRLDPRPDGTFVPSARVYLSPSFRTSGLLAAFPPEELKTLVCALTFATANGRIAPTASQIAEGLAVGGRKAADRMRRLSAFRWQGKEVASLRPGAGGEAAVTPSPGIVAQEDPPEDPPPSAPTGRPGSPARAGAVLAYSRERYGRPRSAVERQIARTLARGDGDAADPLRPRLLAYGVPPATADRLLAAYPAERIERQLDYIDERDARAPGRLLAAAIEGDYAPPMKARLREREAAEAEEPA